MLASRAAFTSAPQLATPFIIKWAAVGGGELDLGNASRWTAVCLMTGPTRRLSPAITLCLVLVRISPGKLAEGILVDARLGG